METDKVEGIKLIAFDLDGVLVDGGGSWIQVHRELGTLEQSRVNGRDYFEGRITFEEWARRDVSLWEGVPIDRINSILYNSPLMPGIEEAIPYLKQRYKVAIISGGLKSMADHLKERFDIDYVYANSLLTKDGKVSGIDHIVDFEGKGAILEELAGINGLSTGNCAAIGDYLNDIPMFLKAGFSIAFDPKREEVAKNASEVVYEKDLRNILKFF